MTSRLVTALTLLTFSAFAEEDARSIAKKSRDQGALNLVGSTAELKLITTTPDGRTREQSVKSSSKRIGGRAHALSVFISPPGVAGVAVLSIEGLEGKADDISLYMPRIKRVRKIESGKRGQSFMDTDFSYADLSGGTINDETLQRQKDETIDGRACYVIAGLGNDDSPYGKVTFWVDKATFVPMKVEYRDRGGELFKRYQTLKLKPYKARTLASESLMENLKAGSKTQMLLLKLDDATLPDEAFSERALERG